MPAPIVSLPEWATNPTLPAGANPWSGQPTQDATARVALAAAGHEPNVQTDAETYNSYLALLTQWVNYSTQEKGGGWYGDGSDGALVTSGDVTLLRDTYHTDITVSAGDTVFTNGFRLFARDTCTVIATGAIRNDGAAAPGEAVTAGIGATAGSIGEGTNGGAGGGTNTTGTVGVVTPEGALGGAGGAGGASNDGPALGGAGGIITPPLAVQGGARSLPQAMGLFPTGLSLGTPTGIIYGGSGGGGGGGGFSGNGGGGGGAGGVMSLWVRRLINNGTISANGGDGGGAFTGPDALGNGGGGGGGGGVIYLVRREVIVAGTIEAIGGAGGAGHLAGSPGVAGSSGLVIQLDA